MLTFSVYHVHYHRDGEQVVTLMADCRSYADATAVLNNQAKGYLTNQGEPILFRAMLDGEIQKVKEYHKNATQ